MTVDRGSLVLDEREGRGERINLRDETSQKIRRTTQNFKEVRDPTVTPRELEASF